MVKKDLRLPSNYRPICLLSCVPRVTEKLNNKQFLKYLVEEKLVYCYQSDFLVPHSTLTPMCYLIHKWWIAVKNGDPFFSLSEACNQENISGLICKLSSIGAATLKWFPSSLQRESSE